MFLFGPPDVEKLRNKRDVGGLIRALAYRKDASVRRHAAQALGGMAAGEAVDALIAALHDNEADVRWDAAWALGQIADVRAVEPLIAALKDGDGHMRLMAATSLGQVGDARAVEPLIAALTDENADTRAAEALGKIGGARAVEALAATLRVDKWYRRKAAAEALQHTGWRPDRGEVGAAYWTAMQEWRECVALGAPAVEPLIAVLRDENMLVRKGATEALGQIGDTRAVDPLIAALQDKEADVRTRVAAALGNIGDGRAVAPLIAVLKDEEYETRSAAGFALQRIGAAAVEPLVAALTGPDPVSRQIAAEVLGRMGDARAVTPLIAALTDENRSVRKAVAGALDKLGWKPEGGASGAAYWAALERWEECLATGTPAVGPLVVALKAPSQDVRKAAARALDKIGWQPDRGPAGAAYCLAQGRWDECVAFGAPAVEPLLAALHDEEWQARRSAATALLGLYSSGALTLADKQRILAQRGTITAAHADGSQHDDHGGPSDCHTDEAHHEDHGVGMDFPV